MTDSYKYKSLNTDAKTRTAETWAVIQRIGYGASY